MEAHVEDWIEPRGRSVYHAGMMPHFVRPESSTVPHGTVLRQLHTPEQK